MGLIGIIMRIAINGFGRIGRCVARALFERQVEDLELVAINDLAPFETLIHLFKYDSVHGKFDGKIETIHDGFAITSKNEQYSSKIHFFKESSPLDLPWENLGVDVVLECSGAFNNYDDAYTHIKSGARRVLISAPCKGANKTVVFGINHYDIDANDMIISNASCTTNCLAPLVHVLHGRFGIEKGLMTTVHAYTPDQKTS